MDHKLYMTDEVRVTGSPESIFQLTATPVQITDRFCIHVDLKLKFSKMIKNYKLFIYFFIIIIILYIFFLNLL